jgi:antitoxin component YwqK of YwqJK toxin-antitoxin module
MKYLHLIALSLFIIGCSSEPEAPETPKTETPQIQQKSDNKIKAPTDELVEIKGKMFTQYYPGKKNIEFQGPQDAEQRRHGKWSFYSESGEEMSTTMYSHGVRHGHMIVKHDNGVISYVGEFKDGMKVGIWKTYTRQGELIEEKDLGEGI